jgi:hypothetical protein
LQDEQSAKQGDGSHQPRLISMSSEDQDGKEADLDAHNASKEEMGANSHARMSQHGPDNQLQINDTGRQKREVSHSTTTSRLDLLWGFSPLAGRKEHQAHRQREKGLRQGGMDDGKRLLK